MKKVLGRIIVLLGIIALGGLAFRSLVPSHSLEARGAAPVDKSSDKTADKSDDSADDDAEKPIKVAPRVSLVDGLPTITLDAEAARRNEVETIRLTNRPQAESLRAYGSVLDLQSLTDLANKFAGAKAERETQQAKSDLAHTILVRARALFSETPQAISKAQLDTAEETYRIDAAGLAAANSQLETLTHTAIQSWGDVLGKAVADPSPLLTGLIERRDVLIQVTLQPDETIAAAPAKALAKLHGGRQVPLVFVSQAAATDPHIQGQSFFYTAPADSGLLPGMNVMAFVPNGATAARAHIPAAAIVWLQGRAWAYFRTGAMTLVRREIATDQPAQDGGYYVKGFPDGAEVVARGAQMLLSEEFRAQIQTEE